MNSRLEQKPLSASEVAAGGVALAAVVFVAFVGLRGSELQAPTSGASTAGPLPQKLAGSPGNEATVESPGDAGSAPGAAIGADHPADPGPGITKWQNSLAEDRAIESSQVAGAEPNADAGAESGQPAGTDSGQHVVAEAGHDAGAEAGHDAGVRTPGRNPLDRTDAAWIQERLRDLGYFSGNASGLWGIASRNALRDFKSMNGLPADDRWDKETEQKLLVDGNIRAADTFIGGWSEDAEECRQARDHSAPLLINSHAAKTDNGECDFRTVRREAAGRWRVLATCSSAGSSWNAHIELKLTALNLKWSSERGSATYLRCMNHVAK